MHARLSALLALTGVIGTALVAAAPAGAAPTGAVLRVASDVSYAPLEFYQPGTKHIVGFDYDLAQALGKRMGRRVEFRNHDFTTILPRLKAGDYDLVMSALNDTRERERDADFIDYFLAGTGILAPVRTSAPIWNAGDLCGRIVDVEAGTAQEAALRKQQERCRDAGLGPITILALKTDEDALAQLRAGKSVAHLSDYPVVAYLARTLDGGHTYHVAGQQFGIAPYGIAVAKSNHALRDAVRTALLDIIRDGTYDTLLEKWGLRQGAFRTAPLNAGPTFQR
ncbi:MAG: ABC transporter substrate-binding protein [Candidatus Eremiobacteraeota bacterium]|nr:ABC transporter substrate-binding protein [Candidatus Eremiobacteraeota bacterium]